MLRFNLEISLDILVLSCSNALSTRFSPLSHFDLERSYLQHSSNFCAILVSFFLELYIFTWFIIYLTLESYSDMIFFDFLILKYL